MLIRILFLSLISLSVGAAEEVYLKTPNLTRSEMIGAVAGIRPYRKTGVRLEAEWNDQKLVIHNYGYGGSGMTLAFGGAHEVVELLKQQGDGPKKVAVLGAGVVGLATAYDLLEQGYEVHLYADQWSPHVTSNVAAGAWTPLLQPYGMTTEKEADHAKLLELSAQRLQRSLSENPEFKGVRYLTVYLLYGERENIPLNEEGEVEIHFDNGAIKQAVRFQRMALEGHLFMEDLFAKVKEKGAILHTRHFDCLDQILALPESVIINCLSFGARGLFQDPELYPVRGQMIHFAPQGIDYILAQRLPESNYMFFVYPWNDRLILGSVYEWGEEEAVTTPEVIDRLLFNAEQVLSPAI